MFAVTIFLSSFLLFQVQPLIGKHILPWYGGSSAVWITAMFFFMVVLAIGYLYALWLSRFSVWYQSIIHLSVVAITAIFTYSHTVSWPSGITPTIDDLQVTTADPSLSVFITLAVTIGLPFVLLSSSSSLLQLWYGKMSGKEPFSLYSISNVGSLLGLLSYPILFEPLFSTYTQGLVWTYGLILYMMLIVSIVYLYLEKMQSSAHVSVDYISKNETIPTTRLYFKWIIIAAVPVMVLLAGTGFMTSTIAAVPFLWVGPLALYLLSFVVTFRFGGLLPNWINEFFVVILSISVLIIVTIKIVPVYLVMFIVHLAIFSVCHWCHEYLYALRPGIKHLTAFYVALSLGGILGSLIIKISSVYILKLPIELTLILAASTIFIVNRWFRSVSYISILPNAQLKMLSGFVFVCIVLVTVTQLSNLQKNVLATERNFFGYKSVIHNTSGEIASRRIRNGSTNHGYQVYVDGVPSVEPSSYYGLTSGIGSAFTYIRQNTDNKIMVVGLGSGALAAHCKSEDEFTFIEIDPQVINLAKNYFTFLEHCSQSEIIIDDARLALEKIAKNKEEKYDLIVLDAYADDMMPIHLMTTDAVATYKSLLVPGGILAVHISSRYLDLLPVIGADVEENNMFGRYWFDKRTNDPKTLSSVWTLLANEESVFESEQFLHMNTFADEPRRVIWTDTYSALFPVIK